MFLRNIWVLFFIVIVVTGGVTKIAIAARSDDRFTSAPVFSYSRLLQRSFPSLVKISAVTLSPSVVPVSTNIDEKDFSDREDDALGLLIKSVSSVLGSGVVVDQQGLVATNAHLVSGATEIHVYLHNGHVLDGKVVFQDEGTDLALIKLPVATPEALPFSNNPALMGDFVLALGKEKEHNTVKAGMISKDFTSLPSKQSVNYFLETDFLLSQGYSGGALINSRGELVGLNVVPVSSEAGASMESYATPVEFVQAAVNAVKIGKNQFQLPELGAQLQSPSSEISQALGIPNMGGLVVEEISPDGLLAKSGIEVGDIILKSGSVFVNNAEVLRYSLVAQQGLGSKTLVYQRNGTIHLANLALSNKKASFSAPNKAHPAIADQDNLLGGVSLSDFNKENAWRFPKILRKTGVVVYDVASFSKFKNLLQRGDVIYAVNGVLVEDVKALKRALYNGPLAWRLAYERAGRNQFLTNLSLR